MNPLTVDPRYRRLVVNAAYRYRLNGGTLDLVDLAQATSLGIDADTFAADVAAKDQE